MVALLLFVLLLLATACGGGKDNKSTSDSANAETTKEKIKLKLATNFPETHRLHVSVFAPFMEEVTEKTDGQVEFEYYPSEQLGKTVDIHELTVDGVADIGIYYPSYIPSKMPITSGILSIPGMYSTATEGSLAYQEISKKSPVLESDYLNHGVRPVFILVTPPSELFSGKKQIKVPEDLKKMKVRVSGDLLNNAITKLAASPINITLSELYEGFERGVFDSINTDPITFNDYGLADHAKFVTKDLAFGGASTGFVMNEKVFQGLPENVRNVIVQAGDQAAKNASKLYDDAVQEMYENFAENGLEVHQLSADEKAKWQKFYSEIEEAWVKEQRNPDLEATINAFREEVKSNK